MKKDYMKPEGNVVTIQVNENVATSGREPTAEAFYGVQYAIVGTQAFIMGNTDYAKTSTGDEKLDRFYDLILTYVHGLSNCRFNPNGDQ